MMKYIRRDDGGEQAEDRQAMCNTAAQLMAIEDKGTLGSRRRSREGSMKIRWIVCLFSVSLCSLIPLSWQHLLRTQS